MDVSRIIFLAAFIIYVTTRGVYIERAKRTEKIERRVDTREQALLALVFVGNILLPLLFVLTPFLNFADYRLFDVSPWIGTVVMAVALGLFWRSHRDLGLNWSVSLEIRREHQIDH
jgi:protein-S-isoprenylcysteine O-methyltransferase Ste14